MTPDELAKQPALKALVDEAQLLCLSGAWEQAIPKLQHILTRPEPRIHPLTQQAMGTCYMNTGRAAEAIACYREAIRLDPTLASSRENMIFLLDAQPGTSHAQAQAERRAWWALFGSKPYAERLPHTNRPDPERRLRVGYVSQDFRFHSAAIAVSPVYQGHSDAFETVLYSTLLPAHEDYVTKQLRAKFGPAFVDVSGYSAETLAQIVRDDAIDILVDLSGYTGGNRLVTFAHKPAPVQVTGWGYATGVGWPAMDALMADPYVIQPSERADMVERVVDLPCVITYQPREDLGAPNELPCASGAPVFAVFQRAMKLNALNLSVWAQILRQVPESRLLFKGPDYSPNVRAWIAQQMGTLAPMVDFAWSTNHYEHLQWYAAVDLSLDPWPQTGGVSTLESLWMGVPTVTLVGDRIIQRTSASVLTTLGLSECIATTREDYIAKAVALVTTDRDRLAEIRRTVRPALISSPIMTGYVGRVEDAYRSLWRDWCATQTHASIEERAVYAHG